jgi:hypothetical protein
VTAPQVTDPHGLLTSGEELASSGPLSLALGCSRAALEGLLGGPLYRLVRFVRYRPGPTLYAVADVRAAFEPYRAGIEARKAQADAPGFPSSCAVISPLRGRKGPKWRPAPQSRHCARHGEGRASVRKRDEKAGRTQPKLSG